MAGLEVILKRGGKPGAMAEDDDEAPPSSKGEPEEDDGGDFGKAAKLFFRATGIKPPDEAAATEALRLVIEACHEEGEDY